MEAMSLLKKEDVLGAWENDVYSLVIMPDLVFLEKREHCIQVFKEPILMKYMDDRGDRKTFNSIMLSENIQIHQIINDDEISIKIKLENSCYIFKRLGFKKEFKFYRNLESPSMYVAIRWLNPWEYVTTAKIIDCNVVEIMTGNIEEQRKKINKTHSELLKTGEWIEVNFESVIPNYRQQEIINEITCKVIENNYKSKY